MSVKPIDIRTVQVMRYVTPLREGGSLPGIAEADDGFLYVLKFRGAGQGTKALIADFIGCELARASGFKVPEVVFANLDEAFGRTEPDEEIQELLRASEGMNLALHYLSGAITYDPAVTKLPELTASKIVWLDALLLNVDRTARNTNMLSWKDELWLIDHGASLYFHHAGMNWEEAAGRPFTQIKDHVLLKDATAIDEADSELKQLLTPEKIDSIVAAIPLSWMLYEDEQAVRNMYSNFLKRRINQTEVFITEIKNARASQF